jgi:3-isopropylmalate/(R)-2-methylmalate dehydratase small subunit
MEKFKTLTSKVIPLPMSDVDTDMIYPAQFLTSISRDGCGKNLFAALRKKDPNFVFNQSKYKSAEILAVDSNFGCGSSREHAVWSIYESGIRVVLGKSFADIFSNNAAKNGLLLIRINSDQMDEILNKAQAEDYTLTVDLESQTVTLPDNNRISFQYDPFLKHCLLNAMDDIDYINSFKVEIESFRTKQKSEQVFSTLTTS